MPSPLIYLTEGSRIFLQSWKNRILPKKYPGEAEDICRQIVKDCWNGRYFQTSTGHFRQFWSRDFGWCTKSLLQLGYASEVQQTLRYALNRFSKAGRITTTITPSGKPYDFPTFAVDSLPWLLHSIRISKFPYYDFKDFLNREIARFFEKVLDQSTGLVTPKEQFSSIKDLAVRKSSCYDNCMVGLLAKHLEHLKLDNPFQRYNYPGLIIKHFWNGNFFYDDFRKKEYVAGDANIFPFITGMVKGQEMLEKSLQAITQAGLDTPFPLKYTHSRKEVRFIPQESLLKDYESTALWMHLGPLYVKLLQQVDQEKAQQWKLAYTNLIQKHHNFLEVFDAAGKPFSTPLYYCDSGMLWAANYLTL